PLGTQHQLSHRFSPLSLEIPAAAPPSPVSLSADILLVAPAPLRWGGLRGGGAPGARGLLFPGRGALRPCRTLSHLSPPGAARAPPSRPRMVYVGRVAGEKNVEAFLRIDRRLEKVVVGDGPLLHRLKKTHPEVQFTGALHGAPLAQAYAAADVLVFPSRTDTF